MRRLLYAVTAIAIAAPAVTAFADNPVTPVDGGTVVDQCYANASQQVNDPGYTFCRTLQAAAQGTAAACRLPLRETPDDTATDSCGLFDGREVSAARVDAYEHSWVHQALSLQRDLTEKAPLIDEQLIHTHNSFNSSAYSLPTDGSAPSYYPTLTNQDPNQVYSLTDQLRMDVRVIEIDLHWVPSPYGSPDTNGYWVTMCHGDGQDPAGSGYTVHVGCSDDRPLQDGLQEVRRWLDAHPDQFLMVYLENQLAPAEPIATQLQAHDTAAQIIESTLGDRVFRPDSGLPAGSCEPMPYDESAQDVVRAAGAQVLLVGNCGPGDAWNQWVFTRGPKWDESGDPTTYGDSQCAADETARRTGSSFRRYFEDRTWLSAMAGGTGAISGGTSIVTPQSTAEMTRCGVNIIGFDQLQPNDGRLAASVWSWAPNEPSTGSCAFQGPDGRFVSDSCAVARPFACWDEAGQQWLVTHRTGPFAHGRRACRRVGATYTVPVNGYQNQQLMWSRPAQLQQVWINYRIRSGAWDAYVPHYGGLPSTG